MRVLGCEFGFGGGRGDADDAAGGAQGVDLALLDAAGLAPLPGEDDFDAGRAVQPGVSALPLHRQRLFNTARIKPNEARCLLSRCVGLCTTCSYPKKIHWVQGVSLVEGLPSWVSRKRS